MTSVRIESSRARQAEYEEPDEWLLNAARRAGHKLPYTERTRGTSAWRMLLGAGLTDAKVLEIACDATGTEPADFSALSPALSNLFSHAVAMKHHAVPIGIRNGIVGVATSNPRSTEVERELNAAAKRRVRLYAASPADILRAQSVVYGTVYATRPDSPPIVAPVSASPTLVATPPAPTRRLSLERSVPAVRQATPAAPRARPQTPPGAGDPTDRLFQAALDSGASELVLEPIPDGALLLRLRIAGELCDRFRIAAAQAAGVVQMLRARTSLHAAAQRGVQRGRTTFATADRSVAIHVEFIPTDDARERVVLRFQPPRDVAALRVLIVDDDVVARRTLARELATGGIEVLEAADGEAALAFVKRLQPHVVLTEVALPKLDAIGILTALASDREAPMVVVRTEQTNGAMDGWLREAGAADVLKRGVETGPLVARLRELVAAG